MNLPSLNYKKLGLIVGFLLLAAVIAYFIISFFFRPQAATPLGTGQTTGGTGQGFPESGNGTPTATVSPGGALPGTATNTTNNQTPSNTPASTEVAADLGVSTLKPDLNATGQLQFYNPSDNKFYRLGADGKPVLISDKQFFGVNNITWSPTNDKAIMEFPDGSKILYDFNKQQQVTLPKYWQDFNFSPTGDKIVAKSMGLDPNNRWLVTANNDGSKAVNVEPLGENGADVSSSWSPNNQTIALYAKGADANRKEVFFVGQNGENFKSIIVEGRGFEPKWSPKGDELLYSVYSADNNYKPTLWLVGAEGDNIGSNRRPLGLDTWANKCSYGGSSLYCAVPQTLDRGAGMFPDLSNSTPDLLYKINPNTGTKELINLGGNSYSMKNITISPDGAYLYFTDSATNRLRRINLR